MNPQDPMTETTDAQEKRRLALQKRHAAINFRNIVKRRREPGEIPTLRVSIRNFCLECCGYDEIAVRECTAPKCWLYPWRLGKLEPDPKRDS